MRIALSILTLLAFAACGRGNVDVAPPPAEPPLYVDSSKGNDANPGTSDEPFKTLTHALGVAVPAQTIWMASGVFDVTTGEVFPLDVPPGVVVRRRPEGVQPVLLGTGPTQLDGLNEVTLVMHADAQMHGVSVRGSDQPKAAAILIAAEGVELHGCLAQGDTGVQVADGVRTLLLVQNHFLGCDTGLRFDGSGQEAVLEGNYAYNNAVGLLITNLPEGGPDLGGGAQGSAGANRIYGNTLVGLWVSSVADTVYAQNGFWEGNTVEIETMAPPPMGTDVLLTAGFVDVANPQTWPNKNGD